MSALPRIIVTHVWPPIPIRRFDWQAHYDGEEDEQMATGHGATPQAAVVDLIENHERGVQCELDIIRITDALALGDIDADEARKQLRDAGVDPSEIEDHVREYAQADGQFGVGA